MKHPDNLFRREDKILFYGKKYPKYWPLSNFYPSRIFLDKKFWPTVEHYYQANKSINTDVQDKIRLLKNPADAKKEGRLIELRDNWDELKDDIMYKALEAKFTQNSICKGILLSTGFKILCEDSPYDKYWGMNGKNKLGELLMCIRRDLKKGKL